MQQELMQEGVAKLFVSAAIVAFALEWVREVPF
jgi:hypothetical protein